MNAQTLPDNPNYCFCPAYDVEEDVQQICIVVEGLTGHIPTAIVTPNMDDAHGLCDSLNARLGLTREDWLRIATQSMEEDTSESTH